jgi:general secretion pathway protein I
VTPRHGTSVRRFTGFTLIEVMVALAIVAITLATGIKAASALGNNAARLADVTAAQWCAENQLTGMKLAQPRLFPSVGDSEFTCEQMGRSYVGKLAVRPTPNPNFRRVDAQIVTESGEPVLTLSTVLPRF